MWNIDIENRIRELNAQADDRHAQLLDTMTETDGSANSSRVAAQSLFERIKRAFVSPRRTSRTVVSRTA